MLSTTPSSTSDEGAPRTLPAQEKEPENRGRYTYRRVDLRQPRSHSPGSCRRRPFQSHQNKSLADHSKFREGIANIGHPDRGDLIVPTSLSGSSWPFPSAS